MPLRTHLFFYNQVPTRALRLSRQQQFWSTGRSISATAPRRTPWQNGDPFLETGDTTKFQRNEIAHASEPRKESFRVGADVTEAPRTEAERFRLSALDLFNTQNYSTHALIFEIKESEKTRIVETIKKGVARTLGQCRHMAGTIERNEHGDYSIVTRPDSTVRFDVQWLDDVESGYPSYARIKNAHFTASSLGDPARLTIEGMTMSCRRYPDSSPSLVAFQLNIIPGGLIFTVHKHHAALDIAGTASFVKQIADNCAALWYGTSPPNWNEEWMDRSRFVVPAVGGANVVPSPAPGSHPGRLPSSWLLFHLSRDNSAKLKMLCSPSNGGWISTYDAIGAILWRVLLKHRARFYKPDLTQPALFFEPINMRARLIPKVPARYQGNCLSAGTSQSLGDPVTLADVISDAPLSHLASFIRRVGTAATQENLEKMMEMMAPVRDKWLLHPPLDALPPMSLVITDWRGVRMCDDDFGFARPAAFRQLSDVVENMSWFHLKDTRSTILSVTRRCCDTLSSEGLKPAPRDDQVARPILQGVYPRKRTHIACPILQFGRSLTEARGRILMRRPE
ncbi:transferase family-domain-containing protein [Xylaria telfairii]|nr:transferase family-domain-containing protein [Xylaria telfairii]